MIKIECPNCKERTNNLENKYCLNCGFSIRNQIYEIKRKQIKYKDKKEVKIKTGKNLTKIIIIAISLIILAIFFPLILAIIGTNNYELGASIITFLTVLLPIISVIGLIILFIPIPNRNRDD